MASGSSQAAHLTPAPLRKHDVFLSFYGKDTRKGFSDHLHTALINKGIFVFRDNEKLKRGENISELLKAIQESEYAVVVISENYAFSKWCLKELTEIVRCKREYRLTILPIFYHVDPSNVQNQKGSFADGLATHGEEFMEERKKWRSALNEVGDTAGWHVHDSYESITIQEVCREISIGLSRRLLNNFKDVVGIESQVKKMMTLLWARDTRGMTNDVHFIGICGMGGLGKTTLARVIFENISSEFEDSCFVEDVRGKLEKNDIVHLQKEIICKILGDRNIEIWSCFDGIKVIANRLQDKKIFIVLDNVDEASQIKALAKEPNWFGQGSRILLISRNKQLLEGFVEKIYEVNELSDNDALQLFCLKAFKKDHPTKNYENLSKEFVNYAHGLPLALEVFGSHLFKKDLLIWESTLKQWKEEPPIEIWKKLKISFDGLSKSQQELFLDIACFFNGEPIDDVMEYLKDVGYYPNSNIEVLQDRSLIKVSDKKFKMHDLLQDMGQRIVCEKSLKNPGERSRLWCSEDIIHILKNNIGTEAVEGIFLKLPLPKPTKLNFEGFSKMKKLKMLVICPIISYFQDDKYNDKAFEHLKTVEWYGNFSKFMLSNDLRILEWWGYPLEGLPTNFEPSNLIKLKIPTSNINHLWGVEKNFEKLKYIDLEGSQNLMEMPDFSQVPNLEKLNVKGIGIRQVSTIVLPEKINDLNVGGSFSKPISLVFHGLLLNMKSLGKLNLSYCNLTDETLPNDLDCLSSLRHLDLSGNKFTIIDCVFKLSNLRDLCLSGCDRLKALPPKLSSRLFKINITNCRSLTTYSDPRDILTSNEALVASDMTLQAIYFGYDGQHYCSTHLDQSFIEKSFSGPEKPWMAVYDDPRVVTWGPTLTSDVPGWFTNFPDIFGIFQRQFEVKSSKSLEATEASLYYDKVKTSSGYYHMTPSWGYALFIVYEVLEHDSCQMRGEIHEGDENGNFSSTIFPVFVCELEVHKINDRKDPMGWYSRKISCEYERHWAKEWRNLEKVPKEYGRTSGKVPIVFRVPNIPSAGRNGVWVFISAHCFEAAGLKECEDLGLCSISVGSPNVEVKQCGGRLVLKNDRSECFEIIKSISPHHLDPETLGEAFYDKGSFDDTLCIHTGREKREEKKEREKKNCHSLTSLTSSEMLTAKDTSEFEAFYFGYNGKCYRTYNLVQSITDDLHYERLYGWYRHVPPQQRHFATVTWGPTLTSDIPEWFTSLPDISGIFKRRFEAEAQRGYLSLPCELASCHYDVVEKNRYPVEIPFMFSTWGYALFIVYEIFESGSCQRKGEIHEVEVDEFGNSSSTVFPEFVCELEVFTKGRTPGKVPIVFRVLDIPSVGRNGVWVFISGSCLRKARRLESWFLPRLECCEDAGLSSISISSPNVDIKECGDRLVLKNDSSECYEIIKAISSHDLDSETLQDAFYEGGLGVFGDMMPGEKRKEGKKQKGVGIYEEGEREGVEIWEEREEEGVEISEVGEKEGIIICEKGEEEKGEICEEVEKEGIDIFEEGEEEGVEICEKGEEVLKERKRKEVGVEICEEGEHVLKERKRKKVGVEICEKGKQVLKERKRKKVGVEICEKGEEVLKESKRNKVLKFMKKGKGKGKKVQKSVTKGKKNVLKSVKEGKRKKMLKFAVFPIYRSFFLFYKLVKSKSEFLRTEAKEEDERREEEKEE